jgi:hypothetical protein
MAQTYTLEEAAQKLNLTPDEMKRRLKDEWKSIRSFRDGSTVRFRAQEIDELARTLGLGSDPEHPTGQHPVADAPMSMADDSGETAHAAPPSSAPKAGGSSGDYFRLAEDDVTATPARSPKPGSDSDVKIEAAPTVKPGSSSKPKAKAPAAQVDLDQESATDEDILSIAPDPQSSKRGSSARHKAPHTPTPKSPIPKSPTPKSPTPKSPTPKTPKPVDGSSDFELKLDDSSDEFELSLDSSDEEVELGASPSGKKAGDSGINLQAPSDSGVSLEKASDSEIDFELSLDPVGSSASSSSKLKGPKSGKIPDSDSEFELTLDSEGELAPLEESSGEQKDIFETDFEIPALDEESASEAVALEEGDTDLESSDFDLAAAEEASDEDEPAVTVETVLPKGKPKKKGKADDEHWAGLEEEEEEEEAAAVAVAPAQWGLLPGLVMIPCVIVMFLAGAMGYELLRGQWGYQTGGSASGPIVRTLAPMFGEAGKEAAKQ